MKVPNVLTRGRVALVVIGAVALLAAGIAMASAAPTISPGTTPPSGHYTTACDAAGCHTYAVTPPPVDPGTGGGGGETSVTPPPVDPGTGGGGGETSVTPPPASKDDTDCVDDANEIPGTDDADCDDVNEAPDVEDADEATEMHDATEVDDDADEANDAHGPTHEIVSPKVNEHDDESDNGTHVAPSASARTARPATGGHEDRSSKRD